MPSVPDLSPTLRRRKLTAKQELLLARPTTPLKLSFSQPKRQPRLLESGTSPVSSSKLYRPVTTSSHSPSSLLEVFVVCLWYLGIIAMAPCLTACPLPKPFQSSRNFPVPHVCKKNPFGRTFQHTLSSFSSPLSFLQTRLSP